MSEVRYPIEALAAAMRLGAGDARRELRMSGQQWARYEETGMGWESAERFAERAGFHPSEVWETWADDEIARQSKVCARPKCGAPFVPLTPKSRYCSRLCSQREAQRRYQQRRYDENIEYRERQKAASRDYYKTAGEYVKARVRKAYHAKKEAPSTPVVWGGRVSECSTDPYSPQGSSGSITA